MEYKLNDSIQDRSDLQNYYGSNIFSCQIKRQSKITCSSKYVHDLKGDKSWNLLIVIKFLYKVLITGKMIPSLKFPSCPNKIENKYAHYAVCSKEELKIRCR